MSLYFELWQHCPRKRFTNENLLDAHSYAGNTTEVLHLLKDELLTLDGGMIHNIKADLILVVKAAYVKYVADLQQEKVIRCY